MKLIKYGHACFTVEKDGKTLVVDPGNLSPDFGAPENVIAVVITHQHPDHFDPETQAQIFDKNDDVLILGPADVIDKVEVENKRVVSPGDKLSLGPFDLEFFGGIHALIHSSMPRVQNVGVMINELLYYPGDSLDVPNKPVDVLALPVGAPWMKIGEAMDFLVAVKPRLAFPTHDANPIVADAGKEFIDQRMTTWAKENRIEYQRLVAPLEV